MKERVERCEGCMERFPLSGVVEETDGSFQCHACHAEEVRSVTREV